MPVDGLGTPIEVMPGRRPGPALSHDNEPGRPPQQRGDDRAKLGRHVLGFCLAEMEQHRASHHGQLGPAETGGDERGLAGDWA